MFNTFVRVRMLNALWFVQLLMYIFVFIQVVMTADVPFKLGAKVFEYLLDSFLFHNFSILNFIKGLQVRHS